MELFEEFKLICIELNKIGIIPTLMGSLGLEYVSKMKWNPADIDIHVPGDPRGWEAPDELRIYNWDKIMFIMNNLDYELIDIHEHEFKKSNLSVEFGSIDTLFEFAKVSEEDLEIIKLDDMEFRVPSIEQFLKIYEASSKDSYRNDNNNNKDFVKIEWIKKYLSKL